MSGSNDSHKEILDLLLLRYDLLSCLDGNEYEKPELADRIDSSQATIYRALNDLEEAGMIEYETDGYKLTICGTILLEEYTKFTALIEDTIDARHVLNTIPGTPSISVELLRNSEIVPADSPETHVPGTRITTLISEGTRVQGLAKAHTQPDAHDVWHRNIVERDVDTELVFQADMYDHLRSLENPKIEETLSSENFTAYTVGHVPFGLLLIETRDGDSCAVLLAYGSEDFLRGILINDSEEAIDWARNVYQKYKQRATVQAE